MLPEFNSKSIEDGLCCTFEVKSRIIVYFLLHICHFKNIGMGKYFLRIFLHNMFSTIQCISKRVFLWVLSTFCFQNIKFYYLISIFHKNSSVKNDSNITILYNYMHKNLYDLKYAFQNLNVAEIRNFNVFRTNRYLFER